MRGFGSRIDRPGKFLTGLSVALALGLWITLRFSQHDLTLRSAAAPETGPDVVFDMVDTSPGDIRPGLESFNEVDERPLFSISRRPDGLQTQQARNQTEERIGAYLLQGIVLGDSRRFALLVDPATNKTLRLAEGQNVGEWTAHQIGKDFDRFKAKGTEPTITLAKPGKEISK